MQENSFSESLIDSLHAAGAHMGYSKTRRHPSTLPYIFGTKNRRDIINLDMTAQQLAHARSVFHAAKNAGKHILFVGTKPEVQQSVIDVALRLGMPYVDARWIGGTLTNFTEMRKRIELLETLLDQREKNTLVYKTKKERLLLERKIEKLQRNFGGLLSMKHTPHLLVVVDTKEESIAIEEARQTGIPVIGLCNTDCNTAIIQHPIIVNDASREAVSVILNTLVAEV